MANQANKVVNLPKKLPTVIPWSQLRTTGFPEEAIRACEENMEKLWKKYDEKIANIEKEFPGLEFQGFHLIPKEKFASRYDVPSASDRTVKVETQSFRVNGGNPKQEELNRSIRTQGYILSEFPPVIIRRNPGDDYSSMPVATGHSRDKSFGHETPNRLVAIWGFEEGLTEEQKDFYIHKLGQYLQKESLPSSGVGEEDAIQSCLEALKKGWIPWQYDFDIDSYTIQNYIRSLDPLSQSYGDDKLGALTTRALNRYQKHIGDTHKLIKPWKSSEVVTKNFVENDLKLIDVPRKVRYITVSSTGISKAYKAAINTWAKDKTAQVRLIVCVSSMKAGNLIGSYHEKLAKFADEWESFVTNANEAHKVGAKNCENSGEFGAVLYGALPSISSLTDMTILKYNSKTRTFYQKETGFQYCIDDCPNQGYTTNKV